MINMIEMLQKREQEIAIEEALVKSSMRLKQRIAERIFLQLSYDHHLRPQTASSGETAISEDKNELVKKTEFE